jgi:glycosyltransferase involved in cell wall biosynthesis
VIHNAVDLNKFSPGVERGAERGGLSLLLVEGSLLGGYEFGLQNAVKVTSEIAHSHTVDGEIELIVVGNVSKGTRDHWDRWLRENFEIAPFFINWRGVVSHRQIVNAYRQAHIFFSADINAACPNSVIESLACGTPVISFDTGALNELLNNQGGIVVPYGANPWELESPDYASLSRAATRIYGNLDQFQKSARKRAEDAFNLEVMVDRYLDVLLG